MHPRSSPGQTRRGFTLVELLVVIAIIGVLAAMLLPAVQRVRESGNVVRCKNNLRQLALSSQNHFFSHGHMPHGAYNYLDEWETQPPEYHPYQNRRCWFHELLPYLEQASLFRAFDEHMTAGGSALHFPQNTTVVPNMLCPSDPANPKLTTFSYGGGPNNSQGFSGNYVACAGNDVYNPGGLVGSTQLNGMFFSLSRIKVHEIDDGASNTLVFSELVLVHDVGDDDIRGRYYNPSHGGVFFSSRLPPNSNVPDRFRWCLTPNPNPRAPCFETGTDIFTLARSYHVGNVNAAFADGSVKSISDRIDPAVFRALGSRNGGESNTSY